MSNIHNSFTRKLMVGITGFTLTFSGVAGVSAESSHQEDNELQDHIAAEENTEAQENGGTEEETEAEENEGTDEAEAEENELQENSHYTDLREKANGMTQEYYEEILEAVTALSESDIIDGYPDGTFRALNSVTRAEAAKIIAKTLDLEVTAGTASKFTDVKRSWAEKEGYLAAVEEAGIMEGYAGKFRPDDKITRAEIAATFVRAFGLENNIEFESAFTDIKDLADWAVNAITTLEANGLAQGLEEGKFGPENNLKRGDTAIFLYRILVDLAVTDIQSVEEQISALDPASDSFVSDVEAARKAYDRLSEQQQDAVTNLADLEDAELTAEFIMAVTITEKDGKAILSTSKTIDGLNTVITLVDSEGNPVTFGELFSSLIIKTTVGEGEPDVNDIFAHVKDLNTIPYGPEGGYTLTQGEDQITELAAELNDEAAIGTYTLTTIIKKGDIVLEKFSKTIDIAEEETTN